MNLVFAGNASGCLCSALSPPHRFLYTINCVCPTGTSRHLLTGVPIEPVRGQSLHLEVTDSSVVLPSMALSVNDSFEYVTFPINFHNAVVFLLTRMRRLSDKQGQEREWVHTCRLHSHVEARQKSILSD